MKNIIKDRKTLTLGLCLILICIFTLTVAYSALSAVLTINGNARVSAADWDIYLDNPRVTGGSATTDIPIVNGVTATFNTTLNMPGDFYEFVVDVVNGGDIDAMIENVVKTPDLTAEQAKFLKYEITYQNNEPITTKQLLAKDTTMPIKVRIEYRKDLSNTDLPTNQVVLDLALTLEYIQSDGTGTSVNNNGVQVVSANGDINEIGTIVTIGTEQFYTIGTEENNVKLLSMYNLYVGGYYDHANYKIVPYGNEATGMQDSTMKGINSGSGTFGVTRYWDSEHKGEKYYSYNGSLIEIHVNNYVDILENRFNVEIEESRLITKEELKDENTFGCVFEEYCTNTKYPWIYSTSYWTGSQTDFGTVDIAVMFSNGFFYDDYDSGPMFGVRPVIIISKDYF